MTDKALTDKGRLVTMMLNCPTVIMDFDAAFFLADHLIANNVVVQKQGEWLPYPSDMYMKCSVCGTEYPKSKMPKNVGYCPNPRCGAKMVKEDK